MSLNPEAQSHDLFEAFLSQEMTLAVGASLLTSRTH
jgi:hypothetical protein